MKYSHLTDINRDNVTQLKLAWTWETGEKAIPAARTAFSGRRPVTPGKFQGTPLILNVIPSAP